MVTDIIYKEQGAGTPEAHDSWFINYDDKIPEMVFDDPGTKEILNEKIKYERRQKDGVSAYLTIMAEFRLNETPRSVNKNLENKLRTVRDELINGQWITALEQLDEITPQGDLTDEIYDRIHLSIDTYIQNKF